MILLSAEAKQLKSSQVRLRTQYCYLHLATVERRDSSFTFVVFPLFSHL